MKKILVPTDFSRYSEYALKVAAQIASENNSEIILLHILELPQHGSFVIDSGINIPEFMFFKNKALSNLEDLMEKDYLKDVLVSKVVVFEKAFAGIMDVCNKNNVDLIIMGSHGSNGFQELVIGSNTEKVVRASKVPVLVIKNEIKKFAVHKFIFASDFTDEIKKSFQKVLDFAYLFDSHLALVMINTPNSFKSTAIAEKIITDFVKDINYSKYSLHVYNDKTVEKGILNFADHENADLIALCTHGRTGFSHFLNGSISEDLVNHTIKPVMTFRI